MTSRDIDLKNCFSLCYTRAHISWDVSWGRQREVFQLLCTPLTKKTFILWSRRTLIHSRAHTLRRPSCCPVKIFPGKRHSTWLGAYCSRKKDINKKRTSGVHWWRVSDNSWGKTKKKKKMWTQLFDWFISPCLNSFVLVFASGRR